MPLSLRTVLFDSLLFILAAQFVLTQGGKVHVIGLSDKLRSFGFLYFVALVCQVTRIGRVTYAFERFLTLTLTNFSRISYSC